MSVIDKECEGYKMDSSNNKIKSETQIAVFFDDSRQYKNDWQDDNTHNIMKRLEHSTQTWEHFLFTIGGKL